MYRPGIRWWLFITNFSFVAVGTLILRMAVILRLVLIVCVLDGFKDHFYCAVRFLTAWPQR